MKLLNEIKAQNERFSDFNAIFLLEFLFFINR